MAFGNDKFAFSRNTCILISFHNGINNDSMRQMFLGIICKKLVFAKASIYRRRMEKEWEIRSDSLYFELCLVSPQ
jgi:hypothetical protein